MSDLRKGDLLYLAGLLHDIGKFYQRADPDGYSKSKLIKADTNKDQVMVDYCPKSANQAYYTHKHVLWTYDFIVKNEVLFKKFLSESYTEFLDITCKHHLKNLGGLMGLLQKADHISSGVDRQQDIKSIEEGEQDTEDSKNWDAFKNTRLVSLMEGLKKGYKGSDQYKSVFPIEAISLNKSFFPKQRKTITSNAQEDYLKLWNSFEKEFEILSDLNIISFNSFVETLQALLQKYLVTVPSSTQHLPDVSLYDHLVSTASIAKCLYEFEAEGNKSNSEFLLVGGDVTGIQKYIYDIVGTDAAKNLKGRSYYLQLVVDTIVKNILDKVACFSGHIIYSSGGGFFLLLPNTEKVKETLTIEKKDLAEKLWAAHKTSLYLVVSEVEIAKDELLGSKNILSEKWKELMDKLSIEKRKKYASKIEQSSGFEELFVPKEDGQVGTRDVITGEEIEETETKHYLDKGNEDPDARKPISLLTAKQVELGKKLKNNLEFVVVSKTKISYWENDNSNVLYLEPLSLGYHYYFIDSKSETVLKEALKGSIDNASVIAINRTDFLNYSLKGKNNTYSFSLLGGSRVPRSDENGNPKTFEELAEGKEPNKLGVLRMDVDNLGAIFKEGFPEGQRTFSRYSSLSRNLDYFFKGYLNTIWKEEPDYKEHTMILYSGGDDLFLIGRWDCIMDLSAQIYDDFKEWVGGNTSLGISGGIAMVNPKFPIAKAAKEAEDAEKTAKAYQTGEKGDMIEKNAMTIWGYALNWEKEWKVVTERKDILMDALVNHKAPKSLPMRLQAWHALAKFLEKRDEVPRWKWLSAYDLGRAAQGVKNDKLKSLLKEIQADLFADTVGNKPLNSPHKGLDIYMLAARWAELENK